MWVSARWVTLFQTLSANCRWVMISPLARFCLLSRRYMCVAITLLFLHVKQFLAIHVRGLLPENAP